MKNAVEFRAWNENLQIASLEEVEPGVESPTFTSDTAGSDDFWLFLWRLRRALWRDLIVAGLLEVRFKHDAETGSGTGPILRFKGASGEWSPVRLIAWDFVESDTMHGDYGGAPGLFGWSEFELANLHWEDVDSDLYEHSFSSEDILVTVPGIPPSGPTWSELSGSEQGNILDLLVSDSAAQVDEFGEMVVDVLDLLCAIAVHPGTSLGVASAARAADPRCAALLH